MELDTKVYKSILESEVTVKESNYKSYDVTSVKQIGIANFTNFNQVNNRLYTISYECIYFNGDIEETRIDKEKNPSDEEKEILKKYALLAISIIANVTLDQDIELYDSKTDIINQLIWNKIYPSIRSEVDFHLSKNDYPKFTLFRMLEGESSD